MRALNTAPDTNFNSFLSNTPMCDQIHSNHYYVLGPPKGASKLELLFNKRAQGRVKD